MEVCLITLGSFRVRLAYELTMGKDALFLLAIILA